MKLLRWMPWKLLMSRAAREMGILDPLDLLAKFRKFAQPSEAAEPLELIRAGIEFHARGIINSRAIQQNLDWIWPFWVEKQFNPSDAAFLPRGFNISHVNLTHRNWTAVGLPNLPHYGLVDPRGLVTPLLDGWSLDFWFFPGDGEPLLPSQLSGAEQKQVWDNGPTVETVCKNAMAKLGLQCRANINHGLPCVETLAHVKSPSGGFLAISVRPYNPEGISFVETIGRPAAGQPELLEINGKSQIQFSAAPSRIYFSNYFWGDVFHRLKEEKTDQGVKCKVGMATAAAIFPLGASGELKILVSSPLASEKQAFARTLDFTPWEKALEGSAEIKVPDKDMMRLFDAAKSTLVLLCPELPVPGPFTYKRFWFRDACFMLRGLLAIGLTERVKKAIAKFLPLQKPSGFFESQQGEWDSNGQVLWLMELFQSHTGQLPDKQWLPAALRAAQWIQKKRVSRAAGKLHKGLLPAGFSAEHFGPSDYYFWDNFWGVAGLAAAGRLAAIFGKDKEAGALYKESEKYLSLIMDVIRRCPAYEKTGAIPSSPYRRLDSGAVGSMVADYPLQLLGPEHPGIGKLGQYLLDNCFFKGVFFQDMTHSGINAYLTLAIAQTLLRQGDPRYRDLVYACAGIASSTGHWPEAVHPATEGGCMGDGQHGWAAAEWIMMMRNLFVREEGNGLVIGSGIFPEWTKQDKNLLFGPTPTPYGPVTVKLEKIKDQWNLIVEAQWRNKPPELLVRVPGYAAEQTRDNTFVLKEENK